jgi:hypothetical protein
MIMNTKSSLPCLSKEGGFGRGFMLFSFRGIDIGPTLSQLLTFVVIEQKRTNLVLVLD